MLTRLAKGPLQTSFGSFIEMLYYDGQKELSVIVMGECIGASNVPCRIHSSCLSSHAFNSIECDCREQMAMAQSYIAQAGYGIIIWLDQEGQGNGTLARLSIAHLREEGLSQTDAYAQIGYGQDSRTYDSAVEILKDLQISSVVLLSNNPKKEEALMEGGISIVARHNLVLQPIPDSNLSRLYQDKIQRGHHINLI